MWFRTNKEVRAELNKRELDLINSEVDIRKKEADADVHIYRVNKLLEIDKLAATSREKTWREVENVAIRGAEQKGEYEHEWHSGMEKKRTELAVLEAKVEAKRAVLEKATKIELLIEEVAKFRGESSSKNIIIDELKHQLLRADDNFKVVVAKLSKVDVDKINISVIPHTVEKASK